MKVSDLDMIEELKYAMIASATNDQYNTSNYEEYRKIIISNIKYKEHCPKELITCRNLGEFWTVIKTKFSTYAGRRNYILEIFTPLVQLAEGNELSPIDNLISYNIDKLGEGYISQEWQKALNRRDTDPKGAITSARSLLETTCKYILDKIGIQYNSDDGVTLYNKVSKELNLSAGQHTEDAVKKELGGCNSIANGMFELRNKVGDSHGEGVNKTNPHTRHSTLAVNSAGTLSMFLLQTYYEKQ